MSERLLESIAYANLPSLDVKILEAIELIRGTINELVLGELDSIYSEETKVLEEKGKLREQGELTDEMRIEIIELLKGIISKYEAIAMKNDNIYIERFVEGRIHELKFEIINLSIKSVNIGDIFPELASKK